MASILQGKSVLVTGATGFVGSHLVQKLHELGAQVVGTTQTHNPLSYFHTQEIHKKVKTVMVDLNDFDAVFDVVTRCNIEYIYHLGAQPLVDVAFDNPRKTLSTNIMGTVNLLEAVRLYPRVKGIMVASSDKAYGKLEAGKKYVETDPLKGDHPYEVSKSAADLICTSYHKTYKLPVVTTRFGNIYGEGDLNYSRLLPGALRALVEGTEFVVRSDGKYVRDYLYVKDVVDGYVLIADQLDTLHGESFNFGSDDSLSVSEVLALIEKELGKKLQYSIANTARNEIPYQSLDYSKIKKMLGWSPTRSLSSTLPGIYEWYKRSIENEKN
jgi:CDP-glucose 4,6-dehydratase